MKNGNKIKKKKHKNVQIQLKILIKNYVNELGKTKKEEKIL